MTDFTPPITSLEAAISVFYRYGLRDASEAALAKALNTTEPDLAA